MNDVEGVLKELDFEYVPTCDAFLDDGRPCAVPATWRVIFRCCGETYLSCSDHRTLTIHKMNTQSLVHDCGHRPRLFFQTLTGGAS